MPNLSKSSDEKGTDLTHSDQEKAEVLSDYFKSVFTKEPEGNWELLETINAEYQPEINIY